MRDYRNDKIKEEFNDFELTCCSSIELAVIYAELHFKLNRKIDSSETIIFQGGHTS